MGSGGLFLPARAGTKGTFAAFGMKASKNPLAGVKESRKREGHRPPAPATFGCAILTPPTGSTPGPSWWTSRRCSATRALRPPRFTPTSARSGWRKWWGGCDALVGERQCLPADEADSGRTSLRLCRPSRLIRRPVSQVPQETLAEGFFCVEVLNAPLRTNHAKIHRDVSSDRNELSRMEKRP